MFRIFAATQMCPQSQSRAGLKSQFLTEDYTDYIDLYVQIISVEFEEKER